MSLPNVIASVGLVLVLVACSSPQERCVREATRQLQTIDRLIAETEANLERGFAIERETTYEQRLTFCAGTSSRRHHGGFYGGTSFCTQAFPTTRTRPVAIDPAAERRKLAALRQERRELVGPTQQRLAACG